jgi:hypothetical protein
LLGRLRRGGILQGELGGGDGQGYGFQKAAAAVVDFLRHEYLPFPLLANDAAILD